MSAPRAGLDQIVAELAQELAEQSRKISALREAHDQDTRHCRESIGLVAEIMPRLGRVETDLTEVAAGLAEAVTEVAELTSAVKKMGTVDWPNLTEQEAIEQWEQLAQWVEDILCDWYQLTCGQLPDCWPLHRPAVLELSWLRTCYLAAYTRGAAPQLAGEWHTRWRRDALANLATIIDGRWCEPGQHMIDSTVKRELKRPPVPAPSLLPQAPTPSAPRPPHARPWLHDRYVDPPAANDMYMLHYQQEPGAQLSQRGCWQPALREAIRQDLAWRRARAQRTQPPPSPAR
jgi:hypothetical protein